MPELPRSLPLKAASLALVCALVPAPRQGARAEGAAARPNIILCMADDLGWGDVGFNGNKAIRTPHLDALAAAGLKFERFYSAAPVCSPTRGSVVTGRHPYRYGIWFANAGHLPAGESTLAELLRAHGYATGHFGKWHLGTLTTTERDSNRGGPRGAQHYSPPQANGFDVCFSTEAKVPTWDPMIRPKSRAGRGPWWDPVTDPALAEPYGTAYWNERGEKVTENVSGDDSRVIMDRVVPFLRSAVAKGKPFFAVVWFHAPHLPVVAGPKYASMYSRFKGHRKSYYGCITALDEQVGRLRKTLRDLKVARDTMLCFCADNGPEGKAGSSPGSAGTFRGRKRSLYEGGIRVPGAIEWPARIRAGRTTRFAAVTSDYLPTILDILGAKPSDERPLDGVSLLPLIDARDDAEKLERPRPIAFESKGQVVFMENRFKLIHVPRGGRRKQKDAAALKKAPLSFELYDLLDDPSETHDVAAKHPERVRKMAAALEAWRASCKQSAAGKDYD